MPCLAIIPPNKKKVAKFVSSSVLPPFNSPLLGGMSEGQGGLILAKTDVKYLIAAVINGYSEKI